MLQSACVSHSVLYILSDTVVLVACFSNITQVSLNKRNKHFSCCWSSGVLQNFVSTYVLGLFHDKLRYIVVFVTSLLRV